MVGAQLSYHLLKTVTEWPRPVNTHVTTGRCGKFLLDSARNIHVYVKMPINNSRDGNMTTDVADKFFGGSRIVDGFRKV